MGAPTAAPCWSGGARSRSPSRRAARAPPRSSTSFSPARRFQHAPTRSRLRRSAGCWGCRSTYRISLLAPHDRFSRTLARQLTPWSPDAGILCCHLLLRGREQRRAGSAGALMRPWAAGIPPQRKAQPAIEHALFIASLKAPQRRAEGGAVVRPVSGESLRSAAPRPRDGRFCDGKTYPNDMRLLEA